MPFCTTCGNQLAEQTRFCPTCGRSRIDETTAAQASGPAPLPEPLDYEIHGDNLQVLRVKLKPGQVLYAEAGKMLYKYPAIEWESRMTGSSVGEKLWGALKRSAMGESLFLTYFRTAQPGEVGFAGDYPGQIQAFHLGAGQSILVQRDSFLCAQSTVALNIAFVKKMRTGLFGGEGFILERLTGPGTAFIHAGGNHLEFQLKAGESIHVDSGCVVGFDETVHYDIQFAGSIKKAIFGGEGLFLAVLSGPGRVIVQSMTLDKMRRELASGRSGGDERTPLGSLSGLFGSDD